MITKTKLTIRIAELKATLIELETSPFLGNARDFLLQAPANRIHDVESLFLSCPRLFYCAAVQLCWAHKELEKARKAVTRAERYGRSIQIVSV